MAAEGNSLPFKLIVLIAKNNLEEEQVLKLMEMNPQDASLKDKLNWARRVSSASLDKLHEASGRNALSDGRYEEGIRKAGDNMLTVGDELMDWGQLEESADDPVDRAAKGMIVRHGLKVLNDERGEISLLMKRAREELTVKGDPAPTSDAHFQSEVKCSTTQDEEMEAPADKGETSEEEGADHPMTLTVDSPALAHDRIELEK